MLGHGGPGGPGGGGRQKGFGSPCFVPPVVSSDVWTVSSQSCSGRESRTRFCRDQKRPKHFGAIDRFFLEIGATSSAINASGQRRQARFVSVSRLTTFRQPC